MLSCGGRLVREFEDDLLSAEQIAAKTNGHKRAIVPIGVTRPTSFIDVQQTLLNTSSEAEKMTSPAMSSTTVS